MSIPPEGTPAITRPRGPGGTRGPAPALAAVVVGAVLVLLLGFGVRTDFDPQLSVDADVSEALYAGDGRARALTWLLEVLTAPGLMVVRVVVLFPVFVWLVRRGAVRAAAWLMTVALTITPLTSLLKDWFGRVRPAFDGGGARYDSLSFPSGHSSGIATLVVAGLILAWPLLAATARRRALAGGAALIVLVGLTRMWLGVHYLSDVLGGWALGISWTLLTALLFGVLPGGRAALRPPP